MTKSEIYAAYAMTGRTARQIADELRVNVHAIYEACYRLGQPLARGHCAKFSGTIAVTQRARKTEWGPILHPVATIPATAMRAAGMNECKLLRFEVVGDELRIRGADHIAQARKMV